jgi:hypothetical protein
MYFNIVFNEFRFHGLFISLSTFNWRHSLKSLSSAETDLVESALPSARKKSVFAYPKQRATVLVGSVLK